MSMLANAVASIRLGVEDILAAAQDDARVLSAIRTKPREHTMLQLDWAG